MNILRKIQYTLCAAPGISLASAIVACTLTLNASAQSTDTRLIKDYTKIKGISGLDEKSIDPSVLDAPQPTFSMSESFEVDLTENPLTLSSSQGLLMYLGRYQEDGAPTVVKIEGKESSGDYQILSYAHFHYRGGYNTHEFSEPIFSPTEEEMSVSSLRLTVEKVERPTSDNGGYRLFKLNFYPYSKGDAYPDGRKDPLRYGTDYYTGFSKFKYQPNRGILDSRNNYGSNWNKYPTETPWGNDNTFIYEGDVYELPTFDKQGGGQMPHVTEHTLYAMPGDVISLSPYYDLPLTKNYMENFSHWYGYKPRTSDGLQNQDYHHVTDNEGNRLLDFLIDPSDMRITDNAGYFAGSRFPKLRDRYVTIDSEKYFVISNTPALQSFANAVNSGQETLNAILVADIDCKGFSMSKIGGVGNAVYRGKFNGNGHSIKNYSLKEAATSYNSGLFGAIGGGAEICNLKLENAVIETGVVAGVLIGSVKSTDYNASPVKIHNVFVQGMVSYTATQDTEFENDSMTLSCAGGIIGSVDESVSPISLNLEKIAFVGNVSGGFGNDIYNAALIGCIGNSNVTIKDCYADAFVENVIDGMGVVAGKNSSNVGGIISIDKLTVSNSYANVKSSKGDISEEELMLAQNVYQDGFKGPHTKYESAEDKYGLTELFNGKHVIAAYQDSWQEDMHLWMWWDNDKGNVSSSNPDSGWPETDALPKGNWPGLKMTRGGNIAYIEFTEKQWEWIFQNEGLNFIFNAGSNGGTATGDTKFPAYGKDYYFFNNVVKNGKNAVSRTVMVRNNSRKDYYVLANLEGGKTEIIQQIDFTEIKEADGSVNTYSVFGIPDDWEGKYAISSEEYKVGGLPSFVDSPVPTPNGYHRVFVKFDFDWTEYWCDLKAGFTDTSGNWVSTLPEEWKEGSKKMQNVVIINGEKYYFIDIPQFEESVDGQKLECYVSFRNDNGSRKCENVIINYNGRGWYGKAHTRNLILDIHSDGTVDGALFNPTFFVYSAELPIVYAQIGNKNLNVMPVAFEVDGKKYNYINLAVNFGGKDGFSFDKDKSSATVQLLENTWEYQGFFNTSYVKGNTYLRSTQIYADLPKTAHYVYPDDFYGEILADGLKWTSIDSGLKIPAMQTQSVKVPEGEEDFLTVFPTPSHEARWYGTEATFCQPYKTEYEPSHEKNLSLDKSEYHIAADFGHDFNDNEDLYNIDHQEKTIHEPVINFRHIFHIKDGKTFADKYTSSKEANDKYIVNNSRAVSARAGADFQIRLNQQVPRYKEGQTYSHTRTNFYYKRGENLYERVPRVGIEVIDQNGNTANDMFAFEAYIQTQGSRKYPKHEGFATRDSLYHIGNGGGEVFRALYCPASKALAGTYTVRLKAQDFDGRDIKIMGTDYNLYLDEYVVTFLDEMSASLLTEDELMSNDNKYREHRTEYLEQEDVCGPPAVVVDFDQYRAFESYPNKGDYFLDFTGDSRTLSFKWPMPWQQSTYSFAYGDYWNCDFNEYTITNHSSQTRYHEANPNLYDRLYYDTQTATSKSARAVDGPQMGYFYYVNAASDPGVSARLTINDLCPGSTVAVSAWLAEMSQATEVANLCFNFVAVDRDGNREIVHSFVTGYVDKIENVNQEERTRLFPKINSSPNLGKWMHVYYSFIPDLNSIQNLNGIDHYEIELENNCVSSQGADYAVDDIRAYIISPSITARQLNPVCDASQNTVGIRISSRFDKLLVSNGLTEATDDNAVDEVKVPLYFAVLDKKQYDSMYAEAEKGDENISADKLREIVMATAIAMSENGEKGDKTYFNKVEISTNFNQMEEYSKDKYNKAMRYVPEGSSVRYIRTNLIPYDTDLRPGKDYYIVLYTPFSLSEDTPDPTLDYFAVTGDPCQKFAVMTLQGSGIIKIDGMAYTSGEPIDVCYGQRPVVQVDLQMLKNGVEFDEADNYDNYIDADSHYYDWFAGPVDEFMAAREENAPSYYDLLYQFRYGTDPQGHTTGDGNTDSYYIPVIEEGEVDTFAPLRDLVEAGKLVLHSSSYVFPQLKDNGIKGDSIRILTAMPILKSSDDESQLICSQPNEIRLRVQGSSPLMADGFHGIEYPTEDVPIRVGLSQLRSVRELGSLTSAKDSELIASAVTIGSERRVEIPLRDICSYKGSEQSATMTNSGNRNEDADPFVYLVETNDPAYMSLDKHPTDEVAIKNSLLPIGMVAGLIAKTGEEYLNSNNVTLLFDEQMQFREGYFYRVRFAFDEALDTEVEGYCEGHMVFTIKVVPEYAKWTGAESRNWNNDANWSRVAADDILLSDNSGIDKEDFTVSGTKNTNKFAYAPLDFTKVLVERMEEGTTAGYPRMFAATSETISNFEWNTTAAPESVTDMDATDGIQFDMVSLDEEGKSLAMRPWYANTCEQIHFNNGAELTHQEHFVFGKNYQKAWIDMEMTADRWYTLASPLQGVVAGDMYTKTNGGKQDNQLFSDITFNNTDYGRYAPAVYQRGWNKAEAKTYLLGDESHDSKSAAVELNWSRVYNDVEEEYTPGLGYSIRTLTDGITNPDKDENEKVTVRFRLPKADTTYSYFDLAGNTEIADNTTISRQLSHALTSFTEENGTYKYTAIVEAGTEGEYFLVGNPFIARMKMKEFLEANSDDIAPEYWIMTSDRQEATLWDEKSGTFLSNVPSDGTEDNEIRGIIAPMQGFFVKANKKTTSIELVFTPDMIEDGFIDNSHILRAPRYTGDNRLITVTAIDATGSETSRTLINLDEDAEQGVEVSEDVTLLLDRSLEGSPAVYTVAEGHALAINSLNDIVETEVGILAAEESVNTLLFEGIDEYDELRLLDTQTGEVTDLYDGLSVEVKGTASGRFYIVRTSGPTPEATLTVLIKNRSVSVVTATEGVTARAYTPAGMIVGEWKTQDNVLQFNLEPGIYLVNAEGDGTHVTRKFIVK